MEEREGKRKKPKKQTLTGAQLAVEAVRIIRAATKGPAPIRKPEKTRLNED